MKRSLVTALLAVLTIFTVTACRPNAGRPLEELSAKPNGADYVIKRGDTINIKVWGEPKLSGDVFVRDDGKFTLPLINAVTGEGRTLEQIGKDVKVKLQEFIPASEVTVTLVQTAPTKYYLSGAFVKPGEFRSESSITLLQAIATGGGFAPFANESSITMIRKTGEGEIRYTLDYNLVIQGKEPNPELKDGDIVAVQ